MTWLDCKTNVLSLFAQITALVYTRQRKAKDGSGLVVDPYFLGDLAIRPSSLERLLAMLIKRPRYVKKLAEFGPRQKVFTSLEKKKKRGREKSSGRTLCFRP